MTQEALKALIEDLRLNHEYCPKEVILQAADELERLAQPEQDHIPDARKMVTEQEPAAFAGIEMWVGDARIAKYLTKTELHHAQDPWVLMQYSADMCLAKLKEKNI